MDHERDEDHEGLGRPGSVEELIADLGDHLAELIVVLDEDGRILWYNRPAEAVLGWMRADWIGRSILDVLHPEEVGLATELLVSARATGPGAKEPVSYRIASVYDGWVPIEAVASSVELATGRAVLVMSARCLGRTRRPEFIFEEVAERQSVVFDMALITMAQVDLGGRILRANQTMAERIGVEADTLHGVPLVGLLAPTCRVRLARALAERPDRADPALIPTRLNGAPTPVVLHVAVVPDWVGEPLYFLVQLLDRWVPQIP